MIVLGSGFFVEQDRVARTPITEEAWSAQFSNSTSVDWNSAFAIPNHELVQIQRSDMTANVIVPQLRKANDRNAVALPAWVNGPPHRQRFPVEPRCGFDFERDVPRLPRTGRLATLDDPLPANRRLRAVVATGRTPAARWGRLDSHRRGSSAIAAHDRTLCPCTRSCDAGLNQYLHTVSRYRFSSVSRAISGSVSIGPLPPLDRTDGAVPHWNPVSAQRSCVRVPPGVSKPVGTSVREAQMLAYRIVGRYDDAARNQF